MVRISTYLFPTSDAEGNRLYFNPKIERAIAVNTEDGRSGISARGSRI